MKNFFRKLFNRGCVDYTQPYSDPEVKSNTEIEKFYNLPKKNYRIKVNSNGEKFVQFDNGTTKMLTSFPTSNCYVTASGYFNRDPYTSYGILNPNISNIGYNNSKL